MARIMADGLAVCTDCAMICANGELGQGDPEADAAHGELMAAHLMGDAPWLVLSGGEDSEAHFSSRPCDGCGSTLAGDREEAAIVR